MSARRFAVFRMTHKRPTEAGDYILELEAENIKLRESVEALLLTTADDDEIIGDLQAALDRIVHNIPIAVRDRG